MIGRELLFDSDGSQATLDQRHALVWSYVDPLGRSRHGLIRDEDMLPSPKLEILDALLYAIANAENRDLVGILAGAVATLAEYQEGIGPCPLVLSENGDDSVLERYTALMSNDLTVMSQWVRVAYHANPHIKPACWRLWQRARRRGIHAPDYPGHVDVGLSYDNS